jgi:hypothetical protein
MLLQAKQKQPPAASAARHVLLAHEVSEPRVSSRVTASLWQPPVTTWKPRDSAFPHGGLVLKKLLIWNVLPSGRPCRPRRLASGGSTIMRVMAMIVIILSRRDTLPISTGRSVSRRAAASVLSSRTP